MNGCILCIVAGGIGGLVKSLLEHNGGIVMPEQEDGIIVLGTLADVLGGAVIGWASTNELVYSYFSASEPNFALALFLGIAWMPVIQAILNRLGLLKEKIKRNNSVDRVKSEILPLLIIR